MDHVKKNKSVIFSDIEGPNQKFRHSNTCSQKQETLKMSHKVDVLPLVQLCRRNRMMECDTEHNKNTTLTVFKRDFLLFHSIYTSCPFKRLFKTTKERKNLERHHLNVKDLLRNWLHQCMWNVQFVARYELLTHLVIGCLLVCTLVSSRSGEMVCTTVSRKKKIRSTEWITEEEHQEIPSNCG